MSVNKSGQVSLLRLCDCRDPKVASFDISTAKVVLIEKHLKLDNHLRKMAAASKDVIEALKEVDLNTKKDHPEMACAYCSKPNPTKRCSKRHGKCMKKMFCDKSCETADHRPKKTESSSEATPETEDEQTAKMKEEQEKAEKAKKKKAKKAAMAAKKQGDGQFWWNNSVYASW